jgi:hypothetical protein
MSVSRMRPVMICTSGFYSSLFQLDLRPFLRWGHEYMAPQGSGRATAGSSKTWLNADNSLLCRGVLFPVATLNVCSVLLSLLNVLQCALQNTDTTATREQNSEVRIFSPLCIYLWGITIAVNNNKNKNSTVQCNISAHHNVRNTIRPVM